MTTTPNAQEPLRLVLDLPTATPENHKDGWILSAEFLRSLCIRVAARSEWQVSMEEAEELLLALTTLDAPVVARDEAAELREAVKEYLAALASRSELDGWRAPIEEFKERNKRVADALDNLRRLVETED